MLKGKNILLAVCGGIAALKKLYISCVNMYDTCKIEEVEQ